MLRIKPAKIIWFIALGLFVWAFILLIAGCDVAEARYKTLYEKQVAINDTLQTQIEDLFDEVDQVFQLANRKIDSLNTVIEVKNGIITSLNYEIIRLNDVIANYDTAQVIRNFSRELDIYLFHPLHLRITQIVDSLNRR